jgi:hypothetical protein
MPADVQIKCISLTTKGKARRRGGGIFRVRKTLSEIEMSICFSSKRKKAEGIAAFLRALPADVLIKNSGSARESAGNNIKKGVHVAAAPAH